MSVSLDRLHKLWRWGFLEALKLHKNQVEICNSIDSLEVRTVVVLCARRFGKTHLALVMALMDCLKNPGISVRVIGPSLTHITEVVGPVFSKIISDAPSGLIVQHKSTRRWSVGESQLILGGFSSDNIESHRGTESYRVYVEETQLSKPSEYDYAMREVIGPTVLHSPAKVKIIHLTTPPRNSSHPFVLDTIEKAKTSSSFFTYTIHDNPRLSDDQIREALEDAGGEHTAAWRREYLAEIVKDESFLIVPSFDKGRHTFERRLPVRRDWILGVDTGGSLDKTVILLSVWDRVSQKLIVVDEAVLEPNTGTHAWVQRAKDLESQYCGSEKVLRFVDCAYGTQTDLQRHHNFRIDRLRKFDRETSLKSLNTAFYNNRISIFPTCRLLIDTLDSGQYSSNGKDFERSPALGHCDAIDALRYMWVSKDGKVSGSLNAVCEEDSDSFTTGEYESRSIYIGAVFGNVSRSSVFVAIDHSGSVIGYRRFLVSSGVDQVCKLFELRKSLVELNSHSCPNIVIHYDGSGKGQSLEYDLSEGAEGADVHRIEMGAQREALYDDLYAFVEREELLLNGIKILVDEFELARSMPVSHDPTSQVRFYESVDALALVSGAFMSEVLRKRQLQSGVKVKREHFRFFTPEIGKSCAKRLDLFIDGYPVFLESYSLSDFELIQGAYVDKDSGTFSLASLAFGQGKIYLLDVFHGPLLFVEQVELLLEQELLSYWGMKNSKESQKRRRDYLVYDTSNFKSFDSYGLNRLYPVGPDIFVNEHAGVIDLFKNELFLKEGLDRKVIESILMWPIEISGTAIIKSIYLAVQGRAQRKSSAQKKLAIMMGNAYGKL